MSRGRYLLVGVSAIALAGGAGALYVAPLMADPAGIKDCGNVLPPLPAPSGHAPTSVAEPQWAQRGGTVNDASCLSRTAVKGVVRPTSEAEVAQALAYARATGLPVSAAGVKHSMGGQAFRAGGVVLDMRGMDAITLDRDARTVTVGAGTTWHAIQQAIHPDFAVKAMQSTDIFSVGGSISVNAHGMDHQAGAVMGSLRNIRLMLADGRVVTVSRTENPDLFRHVVGGYGLFGVILSATLDVVPNAIYRSERALIDYRAFPATFERIAADPSVGLAYVHLSTAPGSLLTEALVYQYRQFPEDQALTRAPLGEVPSTKVRRLTVNLAKKNDLFKTMKWWSEKHLEHRLEACTITRATAQGSGEACLVARNDPMHDSVAYLFNKLPGETDILHEYFVPRDRIVPFIDGMRDILRDQKANLVNASIRAVGHEDNALSYAPAPAFSVVLYLNQPTDDAGTAAMRRLTSALIDLTLAEGGRFFLPYQLHYSPEQLVRSYPEIGAFFAAKRQWDPDGLFSNSWYARYAPLAGKQPAATRPSITSGAPAA
ncbi:FAD-binding oxidoreductase [Sphingomonas pseudosanguinis]|uniref:FAD/FMN-containing dehydrogenase n=1 Tax=Sphingomonas pseudosanguinis TaxID=413712 RepID=A0A7W6F3V5_9SPHN|nr:FAD-binding oxidoreductase [Sphingomonas pseudosanguinis]MBB3879780.1 FAD/FMN-containing dehydrogenase [Sphingomonas pseudosanguinis]MBN3536930.1 FAD-binding oxidoreductase [Sphingomonas pseudosanguinis]